MFTLGADPEVFLQDSKGNPISAHDLIPGTKKKPAKLARGAAVQADGTACEFNIKPAKTAREFEDNVMDALEQVRQVVPRGLYFNFSPSVFYPKTYFAKLPEVAKELGCEPDFDASTGGTNPSPKPTGKFETMRTAAGHVHAGWTEDADIFSQSHRFDCQMYAARCDTRFRPLMKNWDYDKDRTQLYGKTACYRPKPYGVEYRALSVAWLKYPGMYQWIFNTCEHIFDRMVEGKFYDDGVKGPLFTSKMISKELRI